MNNGNWGIVDDAFSPDFIYHGPFGMETRGLADFKKLTGEVMTAFPALAYLPVGQNWK